MEIKWELGELKGFPTRLVLPILPTCWQLAMFLSCLLVAIVKVFFSQVYSYLKSTLGGKTAPRGCRDRYLYIKLVDRQMGIDWLNNHFLSAAHFACPNNYPSILPLHSENRLVAQGTCDTFLDTDLDVRRQITLKLYICIYATGGSMQEAGPIQGILNTYIYS